MWWTGNEVLDHLFQILSRMTERQKMSRMEKSPRSPNRKISLVISVRISSHAFSYKIKVRLMLLQADFILIYSVLF